MRPGPLKLAVIASLSLGLLSCGPDEESHVPRAGADNTYASLEEALEVCAKGGTLAGVDVSSYQHTVDWASVAASGVRFAYAKATEGTAYQDPTFPANWSAMPAHGIARGAYHFFRPGISGTAQADYYLSYVGSLAGSLPPMLDWEVTDGVSASTAAANAQAFVSEIHSRTGMPTVIYTSPGFWSSPPGPYGSFGGNPLWVADWLYCSPANGCCPALPAGWSNWVFWQWSDKGSVPGISGAVDIDVFNGDQAALAAFGGAAQCTNPIGHPVGSASSLSGCPSPGNPPAPPAPTACGVIDAGYGLTPGEQVSSCDHRFLLAMQTDGNLVLYEHGNPLWSTATNGKGGHSLVMQTDGNLVLYSGQSCPLWASNTSGHPGSMLAVQSDGNLVVYAPGGHPLWSSGTGPIPPAPTGCGEVPSGDGLGRGDSVASCLGCYSLAMQGDGNLVLYKKGGRALWSTGTVPGGYATEMQTDGNLVLYSSGGCPMWSTATSGHAGAFFAVQDDGNLVVYSGGRALWSSNTIDCPGGQCSCLPPPPPPPADGGTPPADAGSPPATDGGSSTGGGPPPVADAGTHDAGSQPASDAGVSGDQDGGAPTASDGGATGSDHQDAGAPGRADQASPPAGGCGCGSGSDAFGLLGAGLVLAMERRRRKTLLCGGAGKAERA